MYTVIWKSFLLDRLADFYVTTSAPERERMAGGVELLNLRLATDPLDVGESRDVGYRVVFTPLLMVTFHVNEAARRVRVTDVTRFGR